MSELVVFEKPDGSSLIFHAWSQVSVTEEYEMSSKPGSKDGPSNDLIRRMPSYVTGTIQCADGLTIPAVDSPTGVTQVGTKEAQRDSLRDLEGQVVTIIARSLPKDGISGILRSVTVEDDGASDNRFVLSFEVREVIGGASGFDFDSVEEGFIEVPQADPELPQADPDGALRERHEIAQLSEISPALLPYSFRLSSDGPIQNPGLTRQIFNIHAMVNVDPSSWLNAFNNNTRFTSQSQLVAGSISRPLKFRVDEVGGPSSLQPYRMYADDITGPELKDAGTTSVLNLSPGYHKLHGMFVNKVLQAAVASVSIGGRTSDPSYPMSPLSLRQSNGTGSSGAGRFRVHFAFGKWVSS